MSARFDDLHKTRSPAAPAPVLQRKAITPRADTAQPNGNSRFDCDFSGIPVTRRLGEWLPPAHPAIADTPVHYPSRLPDQRSVRALASDDGIHLGPAARSMPCHDLDAMLAHEGVHAAQQTRGIRRGETAGMESEAHALAPDVLAGRAVEPRLRPSSGTILTETPQEKANVEAAKKRLVILNQYVDEWGGRQARRLQTGKERDPALEKRDQMDKDTPGEGRGAIEASRIAKLNRAPLDLKITDDEVRFVVNFHVRFEDAAMSSRFGEVKQSLEEGIRANWNQKLTGTAFGGRQFVVEPSVTLVSSTAARNQNYWLITVRATDDNTKVGYPGCALDKPPGTVPTSVTDPTCDGGVMSIPPRHITKPDILGHELLHLFGLLDRYYLLLHQVPGKKDQVQLIPSRETGGRKDPLGGESGKVLGEDLSFLFDRLGAYELEENRGLDTLRKLESQGLDISSVLMEIHRQEDLIKRGGKKQTLFKPRTDFNDKMIKDAENL